ncbi:MAG: hypothetical protein RSF33_02345 [Hydrogenoanaerobacterium sp.]
MRKFITALEIILVLVAAVFVVACANNSSSKAAEVKQSEVSSSKSTAEADKASESKSSEPVKASSEELMTVEEVKKMLEPKLEDGYYLMSAFVNGFDTKDDKPSAVDAKFYLVNDSRFTNIAELKAEVEKYYSKELAQTLFYGPLLEDKQFVKYKDIDGKLYCNNDVGGKGFSAGWDLDDLTIESQTADTLKVKVMLERFNEPEGKCEISMIKENGNWVFDKTIDL